LAIEERAMAFKNVLVQLDNHRNYECRLRIALSLAKQSQGRLLALYCFEMPEPPHVSYALAEAYYPPQNDVARETYERQRDGAFDDAAQFENTFRAAARHAGLRSRWETWPEKPKELIGHMTERARYADIAVLGQPDPEHPLYDRLAKLPERVMLGCGRPVIVVPYADRRDTIGKRVLVAWNESREAARALADATPLLVHAEAVTVLTIAQERSDRLHEPARHVVQQLAQHGIRAEASKLVGSDAEAGDLILSRADDLGCDLIVMGGYGHSRMREFILGGATRSILQEMTVPILMSH
jgi:nucleotide-binding universal stress UspA family protein